MKIRLAASPLVVMLAAASCWAARPARGGGSRLNFGRLSGPRSFAPRPLRPMSFAGRAGAAPFSRGLKATPVRPGKTPAPAAGGPGAQTTGGSGGGAPFVGTSMSALVERPGDARVETLEGGSIAYNPPRVQYLTNAPGAFVGAADKAPAPNPGWSASGGASGLNAITPNGPLAP